MLRELRYSFIFVFQTKKMHSLQKNRRKEQRNARESLQTETKQIKTGLNTIIAQKYLYISV